MSESDFWTRISTYLVEKKLQSDTMAEPDIELVQETKNDEFESVTKTDKIKCFDNQEVGEKQNPQESWKFQDSWSRMINYIEERKEIVESERLDCIYDDAPLGFEKTEH